MDKFVVKNNSDDWQDDCTRFIGFMDIMGFKEMVSRNPHNQIKHYMLQAKQTRHILLDTLATQYQPDGNNIIDWRVKTFTFSDSILFVTKSDSPKDLTHLSVAMKISLEASLQSGVPTKGAISHGLVTADFGNSIFFGQPIIDAYLLQDQVFYYGIILDNNAEAFLKRFLKQNDPEFKPIHFIRMPTLLKAGKILHYNIKMNSLGDDQLEDLYETVSGQPRKYVDNTIEMYKVMVDHIKSKDISNIANKIN